MPYNKNIILILILLMAWSGPTAAGTIYHYRDENGVSHFTDLPTSPLFRPFMVFKDNYLQNQEEILKLVNIHSTTHGLDPLLVRAVIEVESGFEPEAVSTAGARGLMQIMPATGDELGLQSPFDPDDNIQAGVRYLKRMLDDFQSVPLALAAYNAGPNAVKRYAGIPPFAETERYVQKVTSLYLRLKEQ
ncbi:MAG: transglycosylase SLT domain-containing protein [Desulfovibrionales bacterium]